MSLCLQWILNFFSSYWFDLVFFIYNIILKIFNLIILVWEKKISFRVLKVEYIKSIFNIMLKYSIYG